MLQRVLEPEVMDTADEARDYDAMDHSVVNCAFATDFLAAYSGNGPALDVGTGSAQIPIQVCRQRPTIRITAIDAASEMIALARLNIERAQLEVRIAANLVDAKILPYPDASFPAVMSNSIVHHIPEPRTVLAEMVRVTSPGGVIFVRDLLRPDTDADVNRLVALFAADCNPHQKKLFNDSLRAAFSLAEIRERIASLGFDAKGVRQTTDRHWTWVGRVGQ